MSNKVTNSEYLEGMCVSVGEATGAITYYKPGISYTKDDIVVLDEWVTSNVALLKEVGGLISSIGGLTSHASIIAREYKIPCLVGVRNIKELKEGTKVHLNATSEEIHIL